MYDFIKNLTNNFTFMEFHISYIESRESYKDPL